MQNSDDRIFGCGYCMGKLIIGGCPKCFRGKENEIDEENTKRFLQFLHDSNITPAIFVTNKKTFVKGLPREIAVLLGGLFHKVRTLLGSEDFIPFAENIKYILDLILENPADLQEAALTDELRKEKGKEGK